MFLLVDEDADKYFKNKHIRLESGLATTKHLPLKPRIVEITKEASGYGFFLKADPKNPGKHVNKKKVRVEHTLLASETFNSF